MSASTAEIREGLATNLATISSSLPTGGWQPSAYMLFNPTPPCAWVIPGETDFDQAMHRGLDMRVMVVQVIVGAVSDRGAQVLLDSMLDAAGVTSIKAAIESDRTLGGKVDTLRVVKQSGYLVREAPQVGTGMSSGQTVGAEFTIEIYD